jgi:hypothetical protein
VAINFDYSQQCAAVFQSQFAAGMDDTMIRVKNQPVGATQHFYRVTGP